MVALSTIIPTLGLKISEFTSSGTFSKHPRSAFTFVRMWAAGGGGGGGGGNAGSDGWPGGGGGGGAYFEFWIKSSDLAADETVTIGAGGTGGAGAGMGTTDNGTGGQVGGNTAFGNFLTVFGGGGGGPGSNTGISGFQGGGGGGGGGILSAGGVGSTGSVSGTPGKPNVLNLKDSNSEQESGRVTQMGFGGGWGRSRFNDSAGSATTPGAIFGGAGGAIDGDHIQQGNVTIFGGGAGGHNNTGTLTFSDDGFSVFGGNGAHEGDNGTSPGGGGGLGAIETAGGDGADGKIEVYEFLAEIVT